MQTAHFNREGIRTVIDELLQNLKEEMKQNRGFIGSKAAEVRQGVLTTRTECGH